MNNMNEYDLIIFDMDGTLYFQRPLQIHMALKMVFSCLKPGGFSEIMTILKFRKLREHWNTLADRDITAQEDDDIDNAQYAYLSAQTGISAQTISGTVQKWIYDKPLSIICKYRDHTLFEIIKKYHLQKKQVVIYSDYPATDKRDALKFPAIPCFYGGQEEIECMKPDPKGISYIMSVYGITDPSRVLMIGDRFSKDGQAAISAGVDYLILKKHKFQRRKQYPLLFSE